MPDGYKHDFTEGTIVFPKEEADQKTSFLTVRSVEHSPSAARTTQSLDEDDAKGELQREARLVVDCSDSAAIVVHDKNANLVVLVRQLRPATRGNSLTEGRTLELPAARIRADRKERDDACARRAALEEVGYAIRNPKHIASIHPSPGVLSEVINIFYADEVADKGDEARSAAARERIEIVRFSPEDLFKQVDNREISDAKLLIAAQWLRHTLPRPPAKALPKGDGPAYEVLSAPTPMKPTQPLPNKERFWRRKKRSKTKEPGAISYKTGLLEEITGIDAWINAENTDMMMPRFFDHGISATIRYFGASRDSSGAIIEDTIQDELRHAVSGSFVKLGAVIPTTSGDLAKSHGVQRVFHVACVQHRRGDERIVSAAAAADGLRRALEMAESGNRGGIMKLAQIWGFRWLQRWTGNPVRSILVPLLGTGNGGAKVSEMVPVLTEQAVGFLKDEAHATLKKIYFIAYSQNDVDTLQKEFRQRSGETESKDKDWKQTLRKAPSSTATAGEGS